MDFAFRDELKELMQNSGRPCISIYMPTHRSGPEVQQNPIRLSNLLKDAEKRVIDFGLRAPEAREILREVSKVTEDSLFWRHQADGLAIFVSPQHFRMYRLPIHFDELVVVTDRFHLKPLLRLLNNNSHFYLLTLSQKEIKFFEATRYGINEIKLEGVPKSIDEALKYDDPQAKQRFHTRVRGSARTEDPLFRAHGVGRDDTKTDILRYFQKVDEGLHNYLKDERSPLVVAGVDYLLPLYREANSYPHMIEEGIAGSPDGLREDELHEKAWLLVESIFRKDQENAAARYMELAGTGLASQDIEEIVPAAMQGRVEAIFVPSGLRKWGTYDPERNLVEVHQEMQNGDEDLYDLAAIQTFLNGGSVFPVESGKVPGTGNVSAIFRY